MRASRGTIFFLCISCIILNAQSPVKKWDVSLAYGLCAPVSDFKKITPENSIYYFTTYPDIDGFDKDGSSAAAVGTYGAVTVNYQAFRSWGVQLRFGHTKNAVHTQPTTRHINDVMGDMFGFNFSVSNEDYNVIYASIGVGYTLHFRKMKLLMYPNLGIGLMASPDYVLLDETDQERLIPFTYEVDQNNIESLLVGLAAAILYDLSPRIYVGFEVEYNHANFDYSLTRKAPGFDPLYKLDRVTYRTLELGIRAGFRF